MIKYTGNDIIKRAEQIADLENSEFISEDEKLALLNDSFLMLYQKIINANDKIFTETAYARSGMFLPPDFYQLLELYIERTKEPIPKKNSVKTRGYEIVDGRLYFSEEYNSEKIVIQYAKIPPTIFIKEKTINSSYNKETLSVCENLYLYYENNEIVICDLYTDVEKRISIADILPEYGITIYKNIDVILCKNGVLLEYDNEFYYYLFDDSYSYTTFSKIPEDKIPAINQNYLYFNLKGTKIIYDIPNREIFKLNIEKESLREDTKIIYFSDLITYQIGSGFVVCNNFKEIEIFLKIKCILSDCLYGVTKSTKQVVKIKHDGYEQILTNNTPKTIVSDRYVLTKRPFDNEQFLESLREDTLLDYPNNLFFVTLSYMLAIQFKTKQSADVTSLLATYEEVKNQFFDSINRDSNQFYQINNVYNHGRVRI